MSFSAARRSNLATATHIRSDRSARKIKRKKRSAAPARISRLRRPADLSLEGWQIALRRQFGAEQDFEIKNLGNEPVFSEFEIANPKSLRRYRVAIRGQELGANYCSCPDFATNNLATCKHIEFTLARLQRKRGGKQALAQGFQPPYSEIYLQYGAEREVRFRPGAERPVELAHLASQYFDADGRLRSDAVGRFDRF